MADGKFGKALEIQKFEYLENEKSFLDEIKSIFYNYLEAHSQVWNIFCGPKPFKNDEKCFLFHLKSCFRSQDI